ncbi:MAG: MarR family transcriptional regulator [Candidatus Methanoperedens sp.]|nr:MarR family transcriptional regulator [Candidatus Methanoperedens sp.]MCZ7383347.1 MarR family transcriptional regulator [Candidatus Methanoperedens sp.]MCZ7404526.1 MarR family transcriptional regulator [Candidatus Methanoperedens sp.]
MSPLEKLFGKTAQLTVLEYLMNNKGEINYLSGIALGTGLYHSSVARVIEPLLQNNIVIEKKIGKQIRSFYLNEEHEATKLLIKFYDELRLALDEQIPSPELEMPVVDHE